MEATGTTGHPGALGVRFDGAALPGLSHNVTGDAPRVEVVRATEDLVLDTWARTTAPKQLLFCRSLSDGTPYLRVERAEGGGSLVWALGFGAHLVSHDGHALMSAVPDSPRWLGLRLLTSQVYPLLALMHGGEVLHAAACLVDDDLIVLSAPSGTGKSSTVSHMLAQGARFFADDAVALSTRAGQLSACPGPGLLCVPSDQLAVMPTSATSAFGERIGGAGGKVYFRPPEAPGARAPRAVVLLARGERSTESALPLARQAPALLGASSLPWFASPSRAVRQLEVLSAVGAAVPVLELAIGPGEPAEAVARRVIERVRVLS